jgi:Response regulator containing a CheY-like receiver domain and a GGDEF domain
MSETISFPPIVEVGASTKRTPTVYFIDDSATMREVIKIAFRRENITVITAGDAATAIAQFDQNPPDAVITDVIMPDQDGYSVCSQIKQHERFSRTPVILMSGVVNKNVADRAVSVGADELIRKPFQPVDLIARVKSFLEPKSAQPARSAPVAQAPRAPSASPLSSLFAPQAAANVPPPAVEPRRESAWPTALANAFQPQSPAAPASSAPPSPNFAPQPPVRPPTSAGDIQKLRTEISRLELLIKKLQTELQIERQYNQALELHVKSLTSLD